MRNIRSKTKNETILIVQQVQQHKQPTMSYSNITKCADCSSCIHRVKKLLLNSLDCDTCVKKTWRRCQSCMEPTQKCDFDCLYQSFCNECTKLTESCDQCNGSIPKYRVGDSSFKHLCKICTQMKAHVNQPSQSRYDYTTLFQLNKLVTATYELEYEDHEGGYCSDPGEMTDVKETICEQLGLFANIDPEDIDDSNFIKPGTKSFSYYERDSHGCLQGSGFCGSMYYYKLVSVEIKCV